MPPLNFTSASGLSNLPPVQILESRSSYRPCHIMLPDSNERTAAIALQGQYYSFFRVEKSEGRTREVCAKLMQRGHQTVATRVPKGFAVWTLEPNAQLVSRDGTPRRSVHAPYSPAEQYSDENPADDETPSNQLPPYRVLVSPDQYQFCNVQVPDLDKRLMAISVDGRYYSLFKTLDDVQQAVQIVKKLKYRGSETIITKNARGYSLWVLEPDAFMA